MKELLYGILIIGGCILIMRGMTAQNEYVEKLETKITILERQIATGGNLKGLKYED